MNEFFRKHNRFRGYWPAAMGITHLVRTRNRTYNTDDTKDMTGCQTCEEFKHHHIPIIKDPQPVEGLGIDLEGTLLNATDRLTLITVGQYTLSFCIPDEPSITTINCTLNLVPILPCRYIHSDPRVLLNICRTLYTPTGLLLVAPWLITRSPLAKWKASMAHYGRPYCFFWSHAKWLSINGKLSFKRQLAPSALLQS